MLCPAQASLLQAKGRSAMQKGNQGAERRGLWGVSQRMQTLNLQKPASLCSSAVGTVLHTG